MSIQYITLAKFFYPFEGELNSPSWKYVLSITLTPHTLSSA